MLGRKVLPPSCFALGAALVGLALAGCSENKNSNQPIDKQSLVGRSCNVDDECGELRCDAVRRHCICRSDDDCQPGFTCDATGCSCKLGGSGCGANEDCCSQLCEDGSCASCPMEGESCDGACCPGLVCENSTCVVPVCNNFTGLCVANVAGCKSDLECPAGEWCDKTVRACKPRKGFCEPCASDHECGGDSDLCVEDTALRQKFCAVACDPANEDSDCERMVGNGASCQNFGGRWQCWPKEGKNCKLFRGCIPDSRKTCETSAQCDDVPDQICDPGSGLCVARVQMCPFGQVCDGRSRVCVDACISDADCIAIDARLRCVNRGCEPLGECAASAEDPTGDSMCPPNKVCSFDPGLKSGVCVPFCTSNNDCQLGSVCQRTADGRSKCVSGCIANGDCPPDKKCVKQAGQVVGVCEGVAGVTCQSDSACPVCSSCDLPTLQCKNAGPLGFCKPCGSDSDCNQGHCLTLQNPLTGQLESRCGQPCPPAGCPRGFVCAEICVGGEYEGYQCSGTLVAECIPVDQTCSMTNEQGQTVDKCVQP
jgi:hypothetical protein